MHSVFLSRVIFESIESSSLVSLTSVFCVVFMFVFDSLFCYVWAEGCGLWN